MTDYLNSGVKILLVWDRIGDYHAARFRALEEISGKGNVLIADLGGADSLYQWKNPLKDSGYYHALSELPVENADSEVRLRAFKNLVRDNNVQFVGIAGYGRKEYRAMLHWCRFNKIRVILFAESWYPGKFDFLKGSYLRFLCDGFLVSGERAREHFIRRLGIPASRVQMPYSVVDNAHFSVASPDYSSRKLLCLARFSPEKNLKLLLQAFQTSGIAQKGWILELVGGGPMTEQLQTGAGEGLVFRNWLAYNDLPSLYGGSSFFILPSIFEPWGLVVNEAMAAGLPVAVSEECGCAPDLVPDERFRFPAADLHGLTELLRRIAEFPEDELQRIGMQNRKRIEAFSTKAWARAFLDLL